MTQCEQILEHMKKYKGISALDAMQLYGIMRLASRIADLRKMGYNICSEMVTDCNRYGDKVSYKYYWLVDNDGR